jgi:C-terminal processing protease CtpA/Prc
MCIIFSLQDSVAELNGLMQGDIIIKINGKNVARATRDSIVKIIK